MNISLLKRKQGRYAIMVMISSPSDIDLLILEEKTLNKIRQRQCQ